MPDFAATSATEGLALPVTTGGATLAALPETPRLSVAPYRGRTQAVASALGAPLSVGTATPLPGGRLVFAGLGLWLLEGIDARARLAGLAAVTDQSDAWCGLALDGPGATDTLARLVPLDLAPAACPEGTAARSLLRHVPLLLVRTATGFDLLVPRSYATTAVAEITEAMARLDARSRLPA